MVVPLHVVCFAAGMQHCFNAYDKCAYGDLDARVLLQHDSNAMQQCRNKPKETHSLTLYSMQSTWNERGHCVHVTVAKPIQHTRQSLHLTAGDGKPAGQPCAQRDWSFLACVAEG